VFKTTFDAKGLGYLAKNALNPSIVPMYAPGEAECTTDWN
jgi:hypothetical protein